MNFRSKSTFRKLVTSKQPTLLHSMDFFSQQWRIKQQMQSFLKSAKWNVKWKEIKENVRIKFFTYKHNKSKPLSIANHCSTNHMDFWFSANFASGLTSMGVVLNRASALVSVHCFFVFFLVKSVSSKFDFLRPSEIHSTFCPFAFWDCSWFVAFAFVFSVVFVVTLKIHDRTPSWHSFYDHFFGRVTFSFCDPLFVWYKFLMSCQMRLFISQLERSYCFFFRVSFTLCRSLSLKMWDDKDRDRHAMKHKTFVASFSTW